MPPSRYLGLGLDDWCQTDFLLTQAYEVLQEQRCPCGCGQWADVAHDPETEGLWEVVDDVTCYAGAALHRWRKDNNEPRPGGLVAVTLQEGDGGAFDPARAEREQRLLRERLAAASG